MIDPLRVTDYRRTDEQLQEFLLFCVVVAGKNADQQSAKLERFLGGRPPFTFVRASIKDGTLGRRLREARIGKYSLLEKSLGRLAQSGIDLRTCTTADLVAFPGIGLKTAKFFLLHSRPGEMHAVLDTHVLSWMAESPDLAGRRVPEHTPQDPRTYRFWEVVFFGMMAERHGSRGPVDWAKADLDLWKERRGSA
jgi:thermostable 8-oxoguanine DNA glycosylase